jgi:HEAT repeat protein
LTYISQIISDFPLWLLVTDIVIIALLLFFSLISIVSYLRLRRAMNEAVETWNRYREKRVPPLHPFFLELFTGSIEKRSILSGVNLLEIFGLQERLIKKIGSSNRSRRHRLSRNDIRRALTYSPDKALFPVFLAAQRKKKIARELEVWLEGAGELFILRRLAVNSNTTPFDGETAADLFSSRLDEVRALSDDPDFRARLFALRILVTLEDERSRKLAYSFFSDGNPEVRKEAARLFPFDAQKNGEKQARKTLYNLMINDPNARVRSAATQRFFSMFPDEGLPVDEKLDTLQSIRLAELMDPARPGDQELAFRFLSSDDPELSLPASRFLDQSGGFTRLFLSADTGDKEGLQHIESVLKKGMMSHCFHYMRVLSQPELMHSSSLLIASRLLLEEGEKKLITALLERVEALPPENRKAGEGRETFLNALKAAATRGNEDSLRMLGQILEKERYDHELQQEVLKNLPAEGAEELTDHLFALLEDPQYGEEKLLTECIAAMSPSLTLHRLIDLVRLKSGEPLAGRKRAMKILLKRGEAAGIQHVLEELPSMELSEAATCAEWLEQYTPAELEKKIAALLKGNDAPLRSRLIAALPLSLHKKFLDTIREALTDANPEVRIAALHHLREREKDVLPLLFDPVPEVREAAARLSASSGSGLAQLKKIIMDPNEVESVKEAALAGFSEKGGEDSARFLLELLEKELEIDAAIVAVIGTFSRKEEFAPFAESLENGSEQLREQIIEGMTRAGSNAESALLQLLDEPEPLRTRAALALEEIGTVDRSIKKLLSRSPDLRLQAALLLSSIGTAAAFRGIVTAVKDPAEEVRIEAIKALQKLKNEKGRNILEDLKQDPVPRVRRYARWADQRLAAEELAAGELEK